MSAGAALQHGSPIASAAGDHAEPNYIAIFIYLTVLTAAELAVYALFPGVAKVAMLVALAWAKAALVAMYFMHLRFERRTLAIVAITPITLVTFLCFMLMPDLTSRLWAHTYEHQQVTAPAGESASPPATAPQL
jgi:cytochrome c oxidase subunit IV